MKIIVTGVTRTGNLGGTAMLCAVEDTLSSFIDCFKLASILPKKDKAKKGIDSAEIVDADYKIWLLVTLPFCLFLWPFRKFRIVKSLARRMPILRDFYGMDAVIDLSGIAFVDGRGAPLLAYNVAVVMPGLFFDIPVYKLSQALGPFHGRLNRVVAKWVLSKCESVAARGEISKEHLHSIGLTRTKFIPDTSFALKIDEFTKKEARNYVVEKFASSSNEKLVMFSPSAVVEKNCQKVGKNLTEIFSQLIVELTMKGFDVGLVPHSTNTGIRKNDDMAVVTSIYNEVIQSVESSSIQILDVRENPKFARAVIAEADVFVACRFHSLIAALSQAVPVTTVGWSHKYEEASKPFKMNNFAMDYSAISEGLLYDNINHLYENRQELGLSMQDTARRSSLESIDGIKVVIE